MSGNAGNRGQGSEPSRQTDAVAILASFRSALKSAQRPRIVDFLPDWVESGHSALLRGLVTLEVAYRLRHGEKPTIAEYRARFPLQHQAIEEAFRHPAATPTPSGTGLAPAPATSMPAQADESAVEPLPPLIQPAAPHGVAVDFCAAGRLGDYELLEMLARDDVGVVYRARQVSVDRIVALKLIMPDGLASDASLRQFYRDTRAVAALDHPGIVPIYEVGEHQGQHFVSMGFVEGETLATKRAGTGLSLREGVEVVRQVAEALAYAHGKGVVHQNLTAKNILLNARGRPKVTGLSSTAPLHSDGSQSMPGRVAGTPGYLAPEQAREGQDIRPAADIHALGAVLYFVFTGKAPFCAPTLVETLLNVLHREPKPPRRLNPSVPRELEAICLKCLQKDPGRRAATAAAVADELQRWLRNEPTTLREESPISRAARYVAHLRLSPRQLGNTVAGVLAAIVLGAELVVHYKGQARAPAHSRGNAQPSGQGGRPVTRGSQDKGITGGRTIGEPRRDRRTAPYLDAHRAPPDGGRGNPSARVGESTSPLVVAGPTKSYASVTGPSAGTEAPIPAEGGTRTAPVRGAAGRETVPSAAESSSADKGPTPTSGRTKPAQVFHKITSIKSRDLVIQARLISDSEHVLIETGGSTRALWRVDLKDPGNPRKLEARLPGWAHLALSSDGRFAILAGMDNSLWNWDLKTSQPRLLRRGRGSITAIALSPDNQLVAYVRDGAIQLCDATGDARGKKKEPNRGMGAGTSLIAFSPDGRRIVSTHADSLIRVWDVKTRRQVGQPSETPKLVSGLAVFPDGRRVIISLSGGQTIVWNLETNRQLRQAPGFGSSIVLSADGRRALIGGGNFMRLWDLVTGEELEREDHQSAVSHVAFSADERQAVASTSAGVHVWALPPGRAAGEPAPVVEVAEFPRRGGLITSVAVSPPDARWILTCEWPNAVRLWNRETTQLIREDFNGNGDTMWSAAFSPDGTRILFGGADRVVHLWDLVTDEHVPLQGHVDWVMTVAFAPKGQRAYSAGGGFQRDGWHDGTDFAVKVWDLATGQRLRRLEGHRGMVFCVAVSTDGRYLLSGGNDSILILWDAKTGQEIRRFPGHTSGVRCVAFLPNGLRAISSSDDGTIRLWEVDSGREVPFHFEDPTGGNSRTVISWKTSPTTGTPFQFKDATGGNWRLAVSPDGHRLFSGGGYELRYWNLDTGKFIQKLKLEEPMMDGSFAPDGRHVVWGGLGGVLRMYRLADIPERPIDRPQQSAHSRRQSGSHDDAMSHNNRGKALLDQAKPAEAIAEYREAIRLKPDYAAAHNNWAWVLVRSPKRPRRDYEEGLMRARKAVELAKKGENYYGTLALAEYRSGHWGKSLAASERSTELHKGGDARDWYFQSMARWQSGDRDAARNSFDKAVALTKEHNSRDVELRQFWVEAAELLGRTGPNPSGAGSPGAPAAKKPNSFR
jgi:WD40 repeat protein